LSKGKGGNALKLATFRSGDATAIGLVDTESARIFDIAAAARRDGASDTYFASMLALIDADETGLDLLRTLVAKHGGEPDLWKPLAAIQLLAPLPRPRQMRDAMSFERHIRQSPRGSKALDARAGGEAAFRAAFEAAPLGELSAVYRQIPIYYITNRFTVVGPDATVLWPRYSQVMDYELEFGIVTRRTRANIPAKEAGAHIFGYTIFNDFSARDRQKLEMQGRLGPAKGKSFDGSNVLGPWIVTPDELGDPQTLGVEVRVNGETRARGETSGMLFSFEEILAYVSQDETIHAGEFFGSGTVGNCCGLEIGRFLESGDTIELHVDRIGVLRNKVLRQGA
jgi:2-keto-4-pentenoate hydratase/2-oxohepta-3-ene-1,7-dioic acid hydratase in catechol pathway